MRWLNRHKIEETLLNFPFVRLLVYEKWFRVGFGAFVFIFIFLGLFVPKIWTSSRPGFLPVVKVSGLDLVQAWSLKRTALRQMQAGKFDEANYAWQAAVANNRADPKLLRGALDCILQDPHGNQRASLGLQEAFWLLRVTQTNKINVELASRVFSRFKYFEPIITLVQPREKDLTPVLAVNYLSALFNEGRMEKFKEVWNQHHALLENSQEAALYHAAYEVGWDKEGTIAAARQELDKACEDPARRVLAYQLKLAVSLKQLNPKDYGNALAKLEELHEDSLFNHLGYWNLLISLDRKDEAARLLQEYPHPPSAPMEIVQMANLYERLGKLDEEVKLLQRSVQDFGSVPIFWVTYAGALVKAKRWEDLRQSALQIRSQDGVRDSLSGFSYYLEGRAELAQDREPSARDDFQKAAEREYPFPTLGYKIASDVFQLGYPKLARRILEGLEKPLGKESPYWQQMFAVADRLQDMDLLLKAGSRAYELEPKNSAVINNYAAALIINRQKPDEAVRLTLQLFADQPGNLYALVNHSGALLLNDRPAEAEQLLSRVNTNQLDRAQLNLYRYDLFETYLGLRQFDRARSISGHIDQGMLYPPQRKWLQEAVQKLPPAPKQG